MIKKEREFIETSIPWLPYLPKDWTLNRMKYLFSVNKDIVGKNSSNYPVLSLTTKGVIKRDIESGVGKFPASFNGYNLVKPKSIMLCLFDLDVTPRVVGHVDDEGIISAAYTNIVPKGEVNSKFYYYYFLTQDKNKTLLALGTGIRITLGWDVFGSLKVPVPPLTIQNSIVKYLDSKNHEIDNLIQNKERLIKVLEEKINYLVNDDYNWRQEKAKWIFDEINVKNQINEELLAVTQNRGVIPKNQCDENFVSPNSYEGLKLVEVNDFVISLRSFQGGIEHSNFKGIVSPAYNVIRLKKEYNNELYLLFYKYYFKSPKLISLLNTVISGIRDGQNINWSDFKNLTLPIPDEPSIKNMLIDFSALDKLKSSFNIEKDKLEEYRYTIVSEMVMGKYSIPQLQMS
jgi:type I restriction enzyme S subunit